MLAYSKSTLKNLAIQKQAKTAFRLRLISPFAFDEIMRSYPVNLFTPNVFVQLGLGVLTFLIVLALYFLLALLTGFGQPATIMFYGLGCYAFLEYLVLGKKHYNSGVDNLLLCAIVIFLTVAVLAFLQDTDQYEIIAALCVCVFALLLAIRYVDSLMAVTSSIAFLFFLFYAFSKNVVVSDQLVPFIMIIASALLYKLSRSTVRTKAGDAFDKAANLVGIVALLSFYISGNYYVVKEMQDNRTVFGIVQNNEPALAWFFWVWTVAVPIFYLFVGIRKRDLVFTRAGILLLIGAVLTYRYYYALAAVEIVMLVSGSILIAACILLIRYLRNSHSGFTFEQDHKRNENVLNLEGLLIGEAFGEQSTKQQTAGTNFGGGSFGGGGAGDRY